MMTACAANHTRPLVLALAAILLAAPITRAVGPKPTPSPAAAEPVSTPTAAPVVEPTVPPPLPESITGEVPRPASTPALPAAQHDPATAPEPAATPKPHDAPSALDAHPHEPALAPDPAAQNLAQRKAADHFSALIALAQRAIAKKDYTLAEAHFSKALSLPVPAADKRAALRQMADFYRDRKMLAKAAAVSEKLLSLFPDDAENPDLYFELGLI